MFSPMEICTPERAKRSHSEMEIGRTSPYENDVSMASVGAAETPPSRLVARASLSATRARLSPADRAKAAPLLAEMAKAAFRAPLPPPHSSPARPLCEDSPYNTSPHRRIALPPLSIYSRLSGMASGFWDWLSAAPPVAHVIAVETTPHGNKRRAIAATPSMRDVPGHFPTPMHAPTPPASRPTSSDGKAHSEQHAPATQQQPVQTGTATLTHPATESQKTGMAALPVRTRDPCEHSIAIVQARLDKKAAAKAAAAKEEEEYRRPENVQARAVEAQKQERRQQEIKEIRQRLKQEAQDARDAKVDGLVHRAKQVTLGSPAHSAYRAHKTSQREEREEKERKVREAAERKEQARRDSIAAALQIQEEAAAAIAAEEARQEALAAAKREVIRPLPPKHADALEAVMAGKNDRTVICTTPEGVELTRRDFNTLLGPSLDTDSSEWLNDEVVNAWLSTIVSRKLEQDGYVKGPKTVPAFVAYNTAWYTTYKSKGVEGLKNWSRRKGITGPKLLRTEQVFFPINTGAHWMLLVISPAARTIEFLDSLPGSHAAQSRKQWMRVARSWLSMELGPEHYREAEWTEGGARSSSQSNGNDCGAFACLNALASARGAGPESITAEKMQDARRMIGAVLINGGFKGDFEL
ncbi:hypothetical protein LTR53_005503 [Teratosphaeriaceae sp. CCFEE 6253]|nr:hypothetical protein LTR53_005503 [Teratosphaeriaceae sp. CCFEE 6253]